MPKNVLIKKYENRRLYDVTNSRYVNLDDVSRLLQQGDEVRVVDAATGDDLTRLVLTQIIVEGAKAPDSGFPLNVLRDMVIASGQASQESAIRYTRAMLDLYKSTYRAMTPAFNPFEFMEPASPASPQPGSASDPSAAEREASADQEEVNLLKHRLAELEKQVSSLAAGTKTSRKPARTPRRRPKAK